MPADNLRYIADRDKGRAVVFLDDAFELIDFQARQHAVQHDLLSADESFSFENRAGASQTLINHVRQQAGMLRDNHCRLCLLQAFFNHVDDFKADEVCQQAVHRAIPAEQKARHNINHNVDAEDNLTGRKIAALAHNHRNHFRAVQTSAAAPHLTNAAAQQEPAEHDRQQLRGVRLAAERREQIAAQRVVDLRAHRGELVPGPVRELPVAVVEELHDLPAVFDGVVDVSHALDEEFPVLVPLVAVGLQHLKFLVCRAARVNAFRFNSF